MDVATRLIAKADFPEVAELFCRNIERNPYYISHGEIQMGVARDTKNLAPDFWKIWENYLHEQVLQDPNGVYVCTIDNQIVGFVISEINKDFSHTFGVICDLLIREDMRGKGIGKLLIDKAFNYFKQKGVSQIFLESGIGNESAHHFFEKHGFKCVSKVFLFDEKSKSR